jgi:hypothetical protein
MSSILEIKKTLEEVLLQRADVVGVGISADGQSINVYVLENGVAQSDIPRMMSGYPIRLLPIPGFQTLSTSDESREKRYRPVVGGVSAAHTEVTAGTIGAIIFDKVSGKKLFLGNNHVFANTCSTTNGRAHEGDSILQPGSVDGGTIADTIAYLYKWIPFDDKGKNIVDCALAMPVDQSYASPYILSDEKLNVIAVTGTRPVESQMRVKKYSRTSGADWGRVLDWNFTVAVDFDDNIPRTFVDQILIEIETRGGDSGSLLLDENNSAVGLVFAGGIDKSGKWYGVANKIQNVLAMLSDGEVDVSDGWSYARAMMEPKPTFDMATMEVEKPPDTESGMFGILMTGVGVAAAAALWQHLNRRKL